MSAQQDVGDDKITNEQVVLSQEDDKIANEQVVLNQEDDKITNEQVVLTHEQVALSEKHVTLGVTSSKQETLSQTLQVCTTVETGDTHPNYLFYGGEIKSTPNGAYIDVIHQKWWHNYEKLEDHHGYIQWLFPVFESTGTNSSAFVLKKDEAKLIREDWSRATRVVKSYWMMLNFYGIKMTNIKTGALERNNIWPTRFLNLNFCSHNHLRITRILTSLGELGFQCWKLPLFHFFEKQILQEGELLNCKTSLLTYWKETLDENSPKYCRKTLEDASDRTDSVFFTYLENDSKEFSKFLEQFAKEEAARKEAEREAKILEKTHWKKWGYKKYTKNAKISYFASSSESNSESDSASDSTSDSIDDSESNSSNESNSFQKKSNKIVDSSKNSSKRRKLQSGKYKAKTKEDLGEEKTRKSTGGNTGRERGQRTKGRGRGQRTKGRGRKNT